MNFKEKTEIFENFGIFSNCKTMKFLNNPKVLKCYAFLLRNLTDSKCFIAILASSGKKKCATLNWQKIWKNEGHHASRSGFFSPYAKN